MRARLMLISSATALLAVILSCIFIVGFQVYQLNSHMRDDLDAMGEIMAISLGTDIANRNRDKASEALKQLRSQHSVRRAMIIDDRGEVIAVYYRDPGAPVSLGDRWPRPEDCNIFTNCLVIEKLISYRGRNVGRLLIDSDRSPVYHALLGSALFSIVIIAVCSLVAARLSLSYMRRISAPVEELVATADRITEQEDFSLRARKLGEDELGRLTDSFNHMLNRIQSSDIGLRLTSEELKRRIDELKAEKEERERSQERERHLQERLVEAQRIESERLREARDEARAANRAKSEFLASMSHEIRTPLNGIIGFTSLLRETDVSADQGDMLEVINSSSRTLLKLLNDILDLSKIEAGKLEIEKTSFNLRDLMEEVVSIFRRDAEQHGVSLELHMAADLPLFIETDSTRLRQILFNLVGNAVKFTDSGYIRIFVERTVDGARSQDADPESLLEFRVEDTGIGIAQDDQLRIFQLFSQADASTTRKYGGAGLGLAISQRLCQMLGGEIRVQSTPGKGSQFSFKIVVHSRNAAAESSLANRTPRQEKIAKQHPLNILVAEDNPTSAQLLQSMLARFGYEADLAMNGQECIDKIKERPYQVVFMDINMPVVDGIEASRRIRAHEAKIKAKVKLCLVAITASALKGDPERCFEAGLDTFLSKPITMESLEMLLLKAIGIVESNAT